MSRSFFIFYFVVGLLMNLVLYGSKASNSKGSNAIQFNNEEYLLEFQVENKKGNYHEFINEYIRGEESLDSWTKLISIRVYPRVLDHRQMAAGIADRLRGHDDPKVPFMTSQTTDGKRILVDFIMMDVNKETEEVNFSEFNVFVYQMYEAGEGVIACQYAERAYGDDISDYLKALKEYRPLMLDKVVKYKFPDIVK